VALFETILDVYFHSYNTLIVSKMAGNVRPPRHVHTRYRSWLNYFSALRSTQYPTT